MSSVGLFWFINDLRIHDNETLLMASKQVDRLICVYCLDPQWLRPNRYGLAGISANRRRFLQQTLADLDRRLQRLGQHLVVRYASPPQGIADLAGRYHATVVFSSAQAGHYENQHLLALKRRLPAATFIEAATDSLFSQRQLPFPLNELPVPFTAFKRQVEHIAVAQPLPAPDHLPPSPMRRTDWLADYPATPAAQTPGPGFYGGETTGLGHLDEYLQSGLASQYNNTRNALDGWANSTKLSPWLANGSLSVRLVDARLRAYEQQAGANESTGWIHYELLWREYFHWYAHRFGKRLFAFRGIKQEKPLTCFYAERFQKWCQGNTPYPLVNACMKELNHTGYLSNRGRQIVASCLVNELAMDWRFGAAYFEQQLLDYDMAVNWGNWQYLAGVGADPRGKRHFDLAKQTRQYDPAGVYIDKWGGQALIPALDSVDAADWPVG